MDNKRIILCIKGDVGSGKTTLINNVAELLKNQHRFEDETASMVKEMGLNEREMPKDPRDCWLVLKKGEKVIIIQSEGDFVYSFKNTELYLRKSKVKSILVLCALRTGNNQTRLEEELKRIQELCHREYKCMELNISSENAEVLVRTQVLQHITDWLQL